MPGLRQYFFAVDGKIRHPTEYFAYEASHINFDESDFERFLQSLAEIRKGRGSHAKLSNA
jgi:hypothetical protein